MKKTIILLALLLFAAMQGAFAQITIFGSVVDAKNGSGIPGASVVVKGTTIGGITNSSGNFGLMNVPSDATLQVSYIGYKTVELAVENQTRFNITLEPDVQVLDEVVVTAERTIEGFQPGKVEIMGMVRDIKTLPYAAYQVSGNDLNLGVRTVAEMLYGRVPSIITYTDPDDGMLKISYLRSYFSFMKLKPPLYVIDGMPYPEDPSSWLNIMEIESITVLPSANAAMLYGSWGVGGVIIITLKKR